MGDVMRWSDFSDSNAMFRNAESCVCKVVLAFRNQGLRSAHAIERAAQTLGLTNRKTRSVFYGEAATFDRAEYQTMQKEYRQYLRQRSFELIEEATALLEESKTERRL